MPRSSKHPAQRFTAPSHISRGTPLKLLVDRQLVALIAESLVAVYPQFNTKAFKSDASRSLEHLELKQRAATVADAMAQYLPSSFASAGKILIASLGPTLVETAGNGLKPFFYLPHSEFIGKYGARDLKIGLLANYELTKRFTAEFSIRPFLLAHRTHTLKKLTQWAKDADPHVRRLVSEGTRPRLPWAIRLPEFQANPNLTIPLLELLKDDSELYVRRSVANHLGDIAKDNLEVTLGVCRTWLSEIDREKDEKLVNQRRWIIRHALRYHSKKGVRAASVLRERAAAL